MLQADLVVHLNLALAGLSVLYECFMQKNLNHKNWQWHLHFQMLGNRCG